MATIVNTLADLLNLPDDFFSGGSHLTDGELASIIRNLRTPSSFSNATRPDKAAADTFPVGTPIFNTDDNAPNYSDASSSTGWRDAVGNET